MIIPNTKLLEYHNTTEHWTVWRVAPCPLSCPELLWVSNTSELLLKSLIWQSPTWEDSDHSLPFMLCWLPPDILVVKKQFRSIDLGKGLAAVKTGKSMVSTEKGTGTQVHNSSLVMKGQWWKRVLNDWRSAENHMLQVASAAPAASKFSTLLFLLF